MSRPTAENHLKKPYARILVPEENGGFSAEILEFPGCFAEGSTANEAMVNLEKAAVSWILASLEQGKEIPEPSAVHGFAGKIALRLPRSLHRQIVRMAERDGTTLNQFILSAIAVRVGAQDLFSRMARQIPLVVNVTNVTMASAIFQPGNPARSNAITEGDKTFYLAPRAPAAVASGGGRNG